MAVRVKEDEKNERAIRSLLKLPENRRCINCNSLGPQYVCTNFWMFVCTTCSGIHREFTHRVKSVSMAKFTSQEVAALQGGGNARAKEILFKEWDPQRHSCPDNSNIERLRDFIRHVYIDRRYSGERGSEMPPKGEESSENKQTDSNRRGSRSPPYEDTYERRYSNRPSPGGRSDDGNSRYGERKSPGSSSVRPEVVNDWHREAGFVNEMRAEGRSTDNQKDKSIISPISRPVRDILAGNVLPLRISGPPKADEARAAAGLANTLRTASSSSSVSADGIPVEPKRETLVSLIDFDAYPELPVKAAVQLPQQALKVQSTGQAVGGSSDANWASFDLARDTNTSHFSSDASNFESSFSQLSVSASVHDQLSGQNNLGGTIPPSSVPPPVHELTGQWPIFPHQPQHTGIKQFTPTAQENWSSYTPSQVHQAVPRSFDSSFLTQPSPVETKSSGRTALPEDLFAATYSAPGLGWKYGPHGGMGFNLQYDNTAPIPTFTQPAKLTNPFDLDNNPPPFQAPSYPSMTSLQGSLPTPSPAWIPPQLSSYPPTLTPQAPRTYMGQQGPSNMPPWNQGLGGYEHPNHSLPGGQSAPNTRGSFPSGGGNPFV